MRRRGFLKGLALTLGLATEVLQLPETKPSQPLNVLNRLDGPPPPSARRMPSSGREHAVYYYYSGWLKGTL